MQPVSAGSRKPWTRSKWSTPKWKKSFGDFIKVMHDHDHDRDPLDRVLTAASSSSAAAAASTHSSCTALFQRFHRVQRFQLQVSKPGGDVTDANMQRFPFSTPFLPPPPPHNMRDMYISWDLGIHKGGIVVHEEIPHFSSIFSIHFFSPLPRPFPTTVKITYSYR